MMASSTNGNGNLVDEFEESFQRCLQALTKQESTAADEDVVKLEVEQTTLKFIDLAQQMEAFFLQKRFLLSALKPELLLKEENHDLKFEINRKEELIKKHYDKIDKWKALLNEHQNNYNNAAKMIPAGGGPGAVPNRMDFVPNPQNMGPAGMPGGQMGTPSMLIQPKSNSPAPQVTPQQAGGRKIVKAVIKKS